MSSPINASVLEEDISRVRIGVIGGGYTGILSSILLSRLKNKDGTQAFDVHLFEEDIILMNGASTAPARLHLGGEYATDLMTGKQCLFSALLFRQMFQTESILTDVMHTEFLVAKESLKTRDLEPGQLRTHYEKLRPFYKQAFDVLTKNNSEIASQLFGPPTDLFESLESVDPQLQSHFAEGVKTTERGLQPIALGVILEILLSQNHVTLHLASAISRTEPNVQGYKLHYTTPSRDSKTLFVDYVISAAWHENLYLRKITTPSIEIVSPVVDIITPVDDVDPAIDIAVASHLSVSNNTSFSNYTLKTKIYLRAIGLYNISSCTPQDRSYFGLMNGAGGMLSLYNNVVAAIYIPETDLSFQGEFELMADGRLDGTFLPSEAQNHLKNLNEPTSMQRSMQSKILNRILQNSIRKYPFLENAIPITLLTRTTLSIDEDISVRSHIKPSWPLGYKSRWVEAESTKATFAPLTALQVLSEITEKFTENLELSESATIFLRAIKDHNFTDCSFAEETQPPFPFQLPEEFVLHRHSSLNESSKFLAQMQIHALKHKLPFAMIKQFATKEMATIVPRAQISAIDWNHIEDVDLRSITSTPEILEALAQAIQSMRPHKGFKSFRFTHSKEASTSSLQLFRALGERPLDEIEIDGLCLNSEDEVNALLNLIIQSDLNTLTLTRFSVKVAPKILGKSLLLEFEKARHLKNVRILFDERPAADVVSILLCSFEDAPELSEFIFSNNNLGDALSGVDEERNLGRIINFVRMARNLKYLDLSNNDLFTNGRERYTERFFEQIRWRSKGLNIDFHKNGLKDHEDTSRKYYLTKKLENLITVQTEMGKNTTASQDLSNRIRSMESDKEFTEIERIYEQILETDPELKDKFRKQFRHRNHRHSRK
jgi:hypothetical protein